MEIRNATLDSFLKSFPLSVLLSLGCAMLAAPHARALLSGFDVFELLHLAYNLTVALCFLIRSRPSAVSLDPLHWTVALLTSFSGFFFTKNTRSPHPLLLLTGDTLIGASILFSFVSALVLRLGYLLKNPSIHNAALLLLVAILYDRRAKYEEDILSHDRSYLEYLQRVKYRFVPGVY